MLLVLSKMLGTMVVVATWGIGRLVVAMRAELMGFKRRICLSLIFFGGSTGCGA